MKLLLLLTLLSATPTIKRDTLLIYYNPSTEQGRAVKQQLTTDFVEMCNGWPTHERLMGLNAVIEHEHTRRRIHKYFDVKFVESYDRMSFRIGAGNRVFVPERTNGPDLREYPTFIGFFDYVLNVHFESYFLDLRRIESDRIWRRWYRERNEKRVDFVFNLIDKGYTEVFSEFGFEFGSMFKDGRFYSLESLGWVEPDPPDLPPILNIKTCPINQDWTLPK